MVALFKKRIRYKKLFQLLAAEKLISESRFKQLLKQNKNAEFQITQQLFDENEKEQEKLLTIFAKFFNLPTIQLQGKTITKQVLQLIPKEVAEQNAMVIFKKERNVIHVATTTPDNTQALEFIKRKTGFTPFIFLTTPKDIKYAIQKYDTELSEEFGNIIAESTKEALTLHSTAEKMAQFVPIIKMVNTIIERALSQGASDIHIQPASTEILVRFRVDGMLQNIVTLPQPILAPLLARIRILSNLKIDENRAPQDGRFSFHFNDRQVAIRVAIIPTLHGAKVVMRLLDMEYQKFTLRRLGLNKRDFEVVKKEITKPHGMILVVGPTGSGKTTTLYTILHLLNRENINICTIEDPIEYGIDGINQTQINKLANLTFANGLRSLLRHDPDVLMVGEIRDGETGEISVSAAMTGHLVLSTLHTNSAFLAPQRLIEMGIPKYLVGSVVNVIIGQRLVRRTCQHCKVVTRSVDKIIRTYGAYFDLEGCLKKFKELKLLPAEIVSLNDLKFSYGRGCKYCNHTGYQGRVGIYEVIELTDDLRKTISNGATPSQIKAIALDQGTVTMLEDGLLKIMLGRTTFAEVLRVTKE